MLFAGATVFDEGTIFFFAYSLIREADLVKCITPVFENAQKHRRITTNQLSAVVLFYLHTQTQGKKISSSKREKNEMKFSKIPDTFIHFIYFIYFHFFFLQLLVFF